MQINNDTHRPVAVATLTQERPRQRERWRISLAW